MNSVKVYISMLLVVCSFLSFSQSGGYKKLMAEKSSTDVEVFLVKLREYQKTNAQYSNVYYQMGVAELGRFSDLDPIVERLASRQYIYNAKINFSLAKNYLDEKDILKNPSWYNASGTSNRDSLVIEVSNFIDKNYRDVVTYASQYEKLVENHDKAVTSYLKARQGFIEINTSAENLRQLFLNADQDLKAAVSEVGDAFDSCIYYLDRYREVYQDLPYEKKRKVKVNLNKIDHFRMNGITPTNFLADEIEMWDYREWSDRFSDLLEDEVDGLHKEIELAYRYFLDTNDKLLNGTDCYQANPDVQRFQRIINLVTKYDTESVLIDIFRYLTVKMEFGNQLSYEVNCNDNTGTPTDDFLSRKSRIYQNLFLNYLYTDSLASLITSSAHNETSFQWFFDDVMTDQEGSAGFSAQQIAENESEFKAELNRLDGYREVQKFKIDSLNQWFSSQGGLLVSDTTGADTVVSILAKNEWSEQAHLLYVLNQETYEIRLAVPNELDYETSWSVPVENGSSIEFFKFISDSAMAIGSSGENAWLQIVRMNGAAQKPIKLNAVESILDVTYNELQGLITVVQGETGSVTISKINFAGKTTSSSNHPIEGDLLTVLTQNQKTWIMSHFSQQGRSYVKVKIVDPGNADEIEEKSYRFENPLNQPYIIKNDNESMTLVARNNDSEDEHIYAILNYEGEITYEQIF